MGKDSVTFEEMLNASLPATDTEDEEAILNRFIYRISNAKIIGKNNQVRTMIQQGFGYSLNSIKLECR
ncbi:transposase [Virgibacillus sp. NKC19-16]|uniref:transposase n=1 Tax=Virgibacillus salidurans TaxID=2831673 RepID=UPI001F3873C2|nr:transposase [Virgibacillus sp. NKC19-16]UJL47434.1 transposase [Virgibacillus sp. NKC19-16]